MITVIANLKGGTGKSTVTFNLAIWLASTGRSTTVIDLDPQRTLSDAAALRAEEDIEPAIHVQTGAFAEVTLPEDSAEIIIDVGTADMGSFTQAVMIADRILIPVTPSQADIWSTQRFVEFLYKNTHGNPAESLTFLNRADLNKEIHATEEAAAALEALPGVRLLPQRLSNRLGFRDSFSEGLSVYELEPRGVASREFKALAESLYGRSNRSLLARLQKQKTSTAVDSSFRQALTTPSSRLDATENVDPAETATERGKGKDKKQRKQNKKKRNSKESKKQRKALEKRQAAEAKRSKENKKARKKRKAKKGKK